MTYVTRATQLSHQLALSQSNGHSPAHENREHIHDRVNAELQKLGMPTWGLWRLDVRYLHSLIHENEHILAAAYGKSADGAGLLVATNLRVIYVDKKPLYVKADELTYDIIGGVSYGDVGVQATVTLHSRIGDFKLRTFNLHLAQGFRDYIEERCLEHIDTATARTNRYDRYF